MTMVIETNGRGAGETTGHHSWQLPFAVGAQDVLAAPL
jgi:hypothetical protein